MSYYDKWYWWLKDEDWEIIIGFCNMDIVSDYDKSIMVELIKFKFWLEWV